MSGENEEEAIPLLCPINGDENPRPPPRKSVSVRAHEAWTRMAEKIRTGEFLVVGDGGGQHRPTGLQRNMADWLKKRQDFQEEIRSGYELTATHAALAFLTYLGLSVLVFSVLLKEWTIIDSLYFAVVTCTTVGYGDMVPDNYHGKIFTLVFSLTGVSLLGMFLGQLGSEIAEAQEDAVDRAHTSMQSKVMWLFDSDESEEKEQREVAIEEQHRKEQEDRQQRSVLRAFFNFSTVMCLLTLFALVIGDDPGVNENEDDGETSNQISLFNAFYFSVMTATTVGYGDYAPVSQEGRLLAVLFIPIAVGAMGQVLSDFAALIIESRAASVREQFSSKALSMQTIQHMDEDGDGRVSQLEFLEFMLVAMNKIDRDLVLELRQHFHRLDIDGTGYLSRNDMIQTARKKLYRIQNKLELSAYKQELLDKAAERRAERKRRCYLARQQKGSPFGSFFIPNFLPSNRQVMANSQSAHV